jgi:hypothetical protein
MKKIAIVLSMAAALSACKTNKQYNAGVDAATTAGYASGQSDAQANAVKAANFMIGFQKQVIGSGSGTVTFVKFAKDNASIAVFGFENAGTTVYYGINVANYTAGADINVYASTNEVYGGLTSNGNGTFSCNAGTCFNFSGPTSSSMVFEKTTASSKDLEKAAAFMEAYQVETMAANLSAQFGLSEERSIKVAKLASTYNKLSQTRALTNADADAFSQELAGVSIADMENAEKAMIGGSMAEMNAVIAKAAEVNGTTTENMNSIMMKLFF